ncbi:MAG TPA: DNA replication and repair protein RecF [Candidatus Saccharimonadales bacterium]|nr:DNA replication and repair protein RecF [Candidatus Saccharimonadales bacterium]
MVFTDIRLQNYRSYKDSSFEFDGGVTIIVGPNAAGKSNLIEAILLVTSGHAYRGKTGLIKQKAGWARIDVHTEENKARTAKITLEVSNDRLGIEYAINDKIYKRLGNQQKHPAVLFEPNNLLLVHGEPQARREYLDRLSSDISEGFASTLLRYKRALVQRNALLKSPHLDKSQLFVWNIRLCELAENIVKKRLATIDLINEKLSRTYSDISGKKTKLNMGYKSPFNTRNYSASLLNKLEADLDLDRARGFTGSGPHREDFVITLDGQLISETASRGETRTLLLALKIIELEILEEKFGTRPLLLLDDVFSELDGARRKALTRFLNKYQTIITTTDADVVLKNFSQNCQIIALA